MGRIPSDNTQDVAATQSAESSPVELRVSEDKMTVLLTCMLPSQRFKEIQPALVQELKRIGITQNGAHERAVKNLDDALEKGVALSDFTILEGTPPVPPRDAEMSWTRDFFATGFSIDDETGAIDYRERLANDAVSDGDLLAKISPTVPGKNGVDVFGKRIKARKPRPFRVKPGKGTRRDGNKFYAESDGRIRFSGKSITVDHVYTVEGSVGLETGHINHPGALIVKENIDPNSIVKATGSIEVGGYVEEAEITAGGDLIITGALVGEAGKKIRVGGQVHAKFLKNVNIEATGDVVALSGIEHCTIKTQGAVRAPQGRIIGGEIVALQGIDAGQIGSEACVTTHVVAGEDHSLAARLEAARVESSLWEKNLARVRVTLSSQRSGAGDLNEDEKRNLDLLKKHEASMKHRIAEIEEELETLPRESKALAKNEIVVRKNLFPGTSATVGRVTKQVNEEVKGPIVIAIQSGDIRFLIRSAR